MEGLVAVVVVIVFMAGMAYALSAVNQAPGAKVADELASCGGGGCETCEQHVQAPEQHRVDVEQVARQHPIGLAVFLDAWPRRAVRASR